MEIQECLEIFEGCLCRKNREFLRGLLNVREPKIVPIDIIEKECDSSIITLVDYEINRNTSFATTLFTKPIR